MFSRTSDYFLDAISTLLQVDVVASGEYLFKSGDVCRHLLIIASGTAETVKIDPQSQQWMVRAYHMTRVMHDVSCHDASIRALFVHIPDPRDTLGWRGFRPGD